MRRDDATAVEADDEVDLELDFSGLSETEREAWNRSIENIKHNLGPAVVSALEDPDVYEVLLSQNSWLWIDTIKRGLIPLEVGGEVVRMLPQHADMLMRIVAPMLGTTISEESPILEGELPLGGHRFEGIIPPVVARPIFAIRKKAIAVFTLDDYVRRGIMTLRQADAIRQAVVDRWNILVVGSTSSGKTTLLNAIMDAIAELTPDHRMVIMQDTLELQCNMRCVEYLRTSDSVSMQSLLRATMRLRPDRICVGEVRDGAALALLKAWNTGHPGGCGTIHADSGLDGLTRLDELVQEASPLPRPALIGRAVNMLLFISKDPTAPAGRRLQEVLAVKGYDKLTQEYKLEPI